MYPVCHSERNILFVILSVKEIYIFPYQVFYLRVFIMSGAIRSLERVILPVAVTLGKQIHVNAIKNGFIRLMPLTLVGAIFVLINNVLLSFGEGSFF